jgi:tetraacyldisaccharide 4'-kinase
VVGVNLVQALLWPLTLPYGALTHLRARLYRTGLLRQGHLDGVVISVGNLTTGGTGKTPMVLWIAARLLAEGKSPGILMRGYRGEMGPSGATSDEVRLLEARLGQRVQFGVGADRYARGRELAGHGVDWFVLDDGFQHLQLARDVDILLIDATNPFGGGRLLPAGRLRESRSALARANLIVITRSDHAPAIEAVIRCDSDAPIFYAAPHLESVRLFRGEYPGEERSDTHSRKFFAFSGIGNPAVFPVDLREWGLDPVGYKIFPDHHRYTPQDLRAIAAQARATGADALMCTEKDIFNLAASPFEGIDLYYCRIHFHVAREMEFWRDVLAVAAKSRRITAK